MDKPPQITAGAAVLQQPLRVLLVEDSGPLTERITALVAELSGVTLVAAVSTELEAIATLATTPIDALILDLHLREGDGFGVLRYLRARQLALFTIVFTSYDIPQYRRAAASLGAAEYFHKSRDYDKLAPALNRRVAAVSDASTAR